MELLWRLSPPDMHHKNTYAEGAIYLQRKAARARLAQIQGMTVRGSRISNTEKYWPFAWEHATQCHNFSAYESLTQLHGHAISPTQAFTGDMKYRVPELREFGEIGYVLYQPSKRPNKLFDTSQRCYYMFNGSYNPFTNIYANAPQAHVVLTDDGQLRVSGKVVFPKLDATPSAVDSTRVQAMSSDVQQESYDEPTVAGPAPPVQRITRPDLSSDSTGRDDDDPGPPHRVGAVV